MHRTAKRRHQLLLVVWLALLPLLGVAHAARPSRLLTAAVVKAFIETARTNVLSRPQIVAFFGTPLGRLDAYSLDIRPAFTNVATVSTINDPDLFLVNLDGVKSLVVADLIKVFGRPRLSPPLPDAAGRTVYFVWRTASQECGVYTVLPLSADPPKAAADNLVIRCDYGLSHR